MRDPMHSFRMATLAVLGAAMLIAACGQTGPETPAAPTPLAAETAPSGTQPQGGSAPPPTQLEGQPAAVALDGRLLVEERCTRCHNLGRIDRATKTEDEWRATVARMVGRGAQLTAAEQNAVIDFLVASHGP